MHGPGRFLSRAMPTGPDYRRRCLPRARLPWRLLGMKPLPPGGAWPGFCPTHGVFVGGILVCFWNGFMTVAPLAWDGAAKGARAHAGLLVQAPTSTQNIAIPVSNTGW